MKEGLNVLKEGLNDSTEMASKLLVSSPLGKGLSFSLCSYGWGAASWLFHHRYHALRVAGLVKPALIPLLQYKPPTLSSQFLHNVIAYRTFHSLPTSLAASWDLHHPPVPLIQEGKLLGNRCAWAGWAKQVTTEPTLAPFLLWWHWFGSLFSIQTWFLQGIGVSNLWNLLKNWLKIGNDFRRWESSRQKNDLIRLFLRKWG